MVLVDCVMLEVSGGEGEGERGGAAEGGEGVGAALVVVLCVRLRLVHLPLKFLGSRACLHEYRSVTNVFQVPNHSCTLSSSSESISE